MNGHLPFIILGGQPASTLHADQGFGAREKAGRAYFGGNAPRIRFRYRTRSLSIGPLPCGFSVKNLPRHWSQTPIYIYIYLIPSINHPSNLPLFRPIFSCSNKPRPENHFPFHLHSNIYIYSKKTRYIVYKMERSMRKCGPFNYQSKIHTNTQRNILDLATNVIKLRSTSFTYRSTQSHT